MVTRAAWLREVPTFSQLWLRELPREPLPLPPRKPWLRPPRGVGVPSGVSSCLPLGQSFWKWLPPHV